MIPSCSIIIPAFKEPSIENTVKEIIKEFSQNHIESEIIIVVDKFTDDNTDEIVKKIARENREIKYTIRNTKNGVADAIRTGIKQATKEVSLIVMADGSEKPRDLVKMVSEMSKGFDMVLGNRFTNRSNLKSYPFVKLIANRLCNVTIRIIFNFNSNDITNAVKAYKTEILKKLELESKGFEIFVEIPLKLFKNGYRNFSEIPICHDAGDEKFSKFRLSVEGPKYFKTVLKCWIKK